MTATSTERSSLSDLKSVRGVVASQSEIGSPGRWFPPGDTFSLIVFIDAPLIDECSGSALLGLFKKRKRVTYPPQPRKSLDSQSRDARLRCFLCDRVVLRVHGHAMFEYEFAAEPTRNRYQDHTEDGERNRNCQTSTDHARAIRRSQIPVGCEDEQRDDVQARVPVCNLLH